MAAPALGTPYNETADVSLTPTLTWGSVGGATDYQVQIARESTFADPDVDTTTEDESLDFSTRVEEDGYLNFGITYYWRVRARMSGTPDAWSVAFAFTTEAGEFSFTPNLDHVGDGLVLLLQQFKGGI